VVAFPIASFGISQTFAAHSWLLRAFDWSSFDGKFLALVAFRTGLLEKVYTDLGSTVHGLSVGL
jgi:hypothetical protein